MLIWTSIAVLAISHGLFLVPFFNTVRQSWLPAPIHLVGISAVAYFDLGMLLEGCGFRYRSEFFSPFFVASQIHIVLAVGLIAAAPWLIQFGSYRAGPTACIHTRLALRPGPRTVIFYLALVATCVSCVAIPLVLMVFGRQMWESRYLLGEILGPWIIVLSLPMYVLAFYVRLVDAGTRAGKFTIVLLLTSSTLSTMAVGERTLILLPFLIVLFFGNTFSLRRWMVTVVVGALAATLMLPMFKYSYQGSGESPLQMLADTVSNDFYRAPELAATMGMSSAFGTRTLPYAGAGYVYAACFFVPRSVAPFKGESSAQQFTGNIVQHQPGSLSWGFGISAISEALLNVGFVLTPVVLIAFGLAIGWLMRKSAQWASLEIPLCLTSLWIFGYHLGALLLNFGAMAVVGLVCEMTFTNPVGDARALPSVY
jgi:hypothetical protein